ncbi:adenylate/guanylate cyclase domain-containing protein [Leptospira meyeri]|uniref:adenylate/guanylate cyclase domain-containing protein n=1 Tax=Leptospira meyeri TaxID=29508 RepID=UPI0002BE4BDF|nr:adenylate/guanylate cyclase domain-containing protein [Leptospira meyeri]EMJ90035.1 adenylate/guanylate cyclase catalytic domain protein [Leptospira meyeri serovar Semaranga str. Veldrot Semarang 173]
MIPIPELLVNPTTIEYFWHKLPWAIPNFFTTFVGLTLTSLAILALKRSDNRKLLISFICFSFAFASLGLVLSLRTLLQDQPKLLFWNRIGYFGVVLLSPSAAFLTYYLTNQYYRYLIISGFLSFCTVGFSYYGLLTQYDFTGGWFIYSFGQYPIAELPLKIWGVVLVINYTFVYTPTSVHYWMKHRVEFESKKFLFLGLHICSFLLITNLLSLVGYPVFPLSSFAFLPLSILGYGIFRSDFLNLNDLLFKQRGLFYFLSGFITTILIVIAYLISFYLHPNDQLTAYIRPYFLIPLLSSVVVFALAIYIAGSNPDIKLNMLASISFFLAGAFTIVMVIFKFDLPLIVHRRLEQIFYTLFVFTPGIHLRFCYALFGKKSPKQIWLLDFASLLLSFVLWTPYFFGGFYEYSFGRMSAGGIGLNVFGLLGMIGLTFFLKEWIHIWKETQNKMANLIVLSLFLGDFLILLNLPATMGIPLYSIGELQFVPALLISIFIVKLGAIPTSGQATLIGNRVSLMILFFVPISMSFYVLNLMEVFPVNVAIYHALFVASPIALAFYLVSFVFLRSTAVKLDQTIFELAEEKIKTDNALTQSEEAKKEIEAINHLTSIINSELEISKIIHAIASYLNQKYGILASWLFLLDENQKEIRSVHAEVFVEITPEQRAFASSLRIPFSEEGGMAYLVWKRKKSLLIPQIKQYAFEIDKKICEGVIATSFLHVPLVLNNETIGFFMFSNFLNRLDLTKAQVRSIENLCAQVAGVIQRVHLLRQTEKQKKDILALNGFIKDINEKMDIHLIMKKIHNYVKTNFGIMYYSLLVADSEKKYLRFMEMEVPEHVTEFQKKRIYEMRLPLKGAAGGHQMALRKKKPIYIPNQLERLERLLSEDDKWVVNVCKITSFLFIPMILNGEVVGLLDLSNSDHSMELTDEDISKLSILGEQLAGIIYSSALFQELEISRNIAEEERRKNEKLLLNILPFDIAEELKEKGATEPILYENVSVMFTDFKGFTQIAEFLSPQELIRDLDACFVQFDKITERYKLEKLKTIGDSYMCAGGIPKRNQTHAIDSVLAALEIQSFMNLIKQIKADQGLPFWELRLGIHSGPLVAGVIGEKKFAYDVWGDTVNTASRMESSGTPGKINVSGETYGMIKDVFECEYRGKINAKNKGEVEMFYVLGLKAEFSLFEDQRTPNENFWKYYETLAGTREHVA